MKEASNGEHTPHPFLPYCRNTPLPPQLVGVEHLDIIYLPPQHRGNIPSLWLSNEMPVTRYPERRRMTKMESTSHVSTQREMYVFDLQHAIYIGWGKPQAPLHFSR